MKNWFSFFSLVINLSALLWGLSALKFSFTWVRRKAPPPQDPPKYEKMYYFFHILGLNLKMSYQIASLFHMYIVMGETIAGKQDRFSLIIQDPLRAPKIPQNIHFFNILAHKWKNGFQIVSPCCSYVSTVMRSAVCWHFGAPGTPGFYVRAQHDPKKTIKIKKKYFLF